MTDMSILTAEERVIFSLRSLYRRYGYLQYKMSKFEEYEFYMHNKDFLVSDRIIAFNDTNGKLLALKPDVTLSIIKSGEDTKGYKQKVCYNENVYRVSESTGQYKEIMQTGVECIGDIDLYDIYEMILLAGESLALISDDFILEISHVDLLMDLFSKVCDNRMFLQDAMRYFSQKNAHELSRVCDDFGVSEEDKRVLVSFVSIYGERKKVLSMIKDMSGYVSESAVSELEKLSAMLDTLPFSDKIIFDFSDVNNVNYYNGIAFKGFISGVSQSVLSGGRYDRLLKKLGRRSGAVGFAIYIDMLLDIYKSEEECDVDLLVVYDGQSDMMALADTVKSAVASGIKVSAQKTVTDKIRYKEMKDMRGGTGNA